ncbi:hypothetical protein [Emticicia sp. SJ17W-69]|uniref:hypothetical protein n=1 Tax=Emticicia sp. SJ17W-69 TaxID=3421657 RepID=UPI003EC05BFA
MNFKTLTAALIFTIFISCASKENQTTNTDSTTVADTVASATTPETESELTPKDDEIREMGLLKEVEDSGYPIATLRIEFPERKFEEYFTVNLEEVPGADINKMRDGVGKYVSFLYKSEPTNALLDVQVNGKSITNEAPIEIKPETKRVVGILKGADEETPGDLPGTVTITTKENTTLSFDFFVTKEMVAVNGKRVVGYYEERTQNIITALKLLPK